MEPFGLTFKTDAGSHSVETNALAREILQHKQDEDSRSYLSKLIVGLTEGFHGNQRSLEKLESLNSSMMLAKMAGDTRGAAEAQKQINEAVGQDLASRRSAQSWSDHTGGFIKSVGLFFPGKGGYAVSALTNATDAARPTDSAGRQVTDFALGAGKGAALKWGFDKIGQSEMNLVLKAGTLSVTNRLAELGLNSHTYFNAETGQFDALGGLSKTIKTATQPEQLAFDAITFGAGFYALKKVGLTPEFAKANPMIAQALTGSAFGFSGGFFADLQAQKKYGSGGFDMASALKSGFVQMSLDGAAAAIGGARMQQLQSRAIAENARFEAASRAGTNSLLEPTQPGKMDFGAIEKHVDVVLGLDNRPIARPRDNVNVVAPESALAKRELAGIATPHDAKGGTVNIATGSREFVTSENVSQLLANWGTKGNEGKVLKVQEVLGGTESAPKLGPEKTMLIQHVEPGLKVPVERFSAAELLATCDPKLLEALGVKNVGQRHLFPEAGNSPVMLQVPGSNRLRFSLPEALKSAEPAVQLGKSVSEEFGKGMTVSDWLRAVDTKHRMSDLHDVRMIAKALEHLKMPIERYLGGGADTIAFQMKNGDILRVTDKPFRTEWGQRTVDVNGKETRFDASILGKRYQVNVDGTPVNYYVQTKGITPVSVEDVAMFQRLVERDGRYVFWDNDGGVWGQSQLAYVPLLKMENGMLTAIPVPSRAGMKNRGIALIDYDAVRIAGTEPKQPAGEKPWGSWRYGQYDFEPIDRR